MAKMKLKQRLVVLSAIVVSSLVSMTCVIYYYADSYVSSSSSSFTLSTPDPRERMRLRLLEKDKMRPSRRKLNKQLRLQQNSSEYDSNRALEVELNDTEYEDLAKKRNLLTRDSHSSSTFPSKALIKLKGSSDQKLHDECSYRILQQDEGETRENFPDLLQFLDQRNRPQSNKKLRITLQEIHGVQDTQNFTSLDLFHVGISDLDLYSEEDANVETLLKNMATMPIVHVEEKHGGTQLKLIITFQDGSQALFKPMRFDRDKETEPNHFYFVDYERHTSEIAAFHIDRILGFRRCPPVVGRRLNITSEIYAVAEDELIKTFFISPAQNVCFHGTCSYYCDTGHAICGRPDTVEGSLAAFLPPDGLSGRKSWKNPWRRSYHKRRKADFEKIPNFCEGVRNRPLYRNTKRLADLVDTTILDFLIGNMDRHHYETFKIFGNDSYILHLDHGRGFGRPGHDEVSILAPLYQCCFVRFATFEQLLQLQHGPLRLSSLMRCSLSRDPLSPILLDKHLKALDRRLEIVLRIIKDCLRTRNGEEVLFREHMD